MKLLKRETHRTDSMAVLTSSRKGYHLVVFEGVGSGGYTSQSKHVKKETIYNLEYRGFSLFYLLNEDNTL